MAAAEAPVAGGTAEPVHEAVQALTAAVLPGRGRAATAAEAVEVLAPLVDAAALLALVVDEVTGHVDRELRGGGQGAPVDLAGVSAVLGDAQLVADHLATALAAARERSGQLRAHRRYGPRG